MKNPLNLNPLKKLKFKNEGETNSFLCKTQYLFEKAYAAGLLEKEICEDGKYKGEMGYRIPINMDVEELQRRMDILFENDSFVEDDNDEIYKNLLKDFN